MALRFCTLLFLSLVLPAQFLPGQQRYKLKNPERAGLTLPFELSQNLIIIPARINGSPRLHLVLDSGINNTIITGLEEKDSITLNAARKIKVGGLGDGIPLEAYYSRGNRIDIEAIDDPESGIHGQDMDIYVLSSDQFELSRQLGMQVNGLLGSDLFINFVIVVDPISKIISFYDRKQFNFRRQTRNYTRIPLKMVNDKAYIDVRMIQENDSVIDTKLLIDTGASLSFWVAPVADSSIILPKKTVRSLLGQGLNGSITGVNGRVQRAQIGPFVFRRPMVSFPDSTSVAGLSLGSDRHGSIGNDILRRFSVIFDFQASAIYLKPNKWFRTPFSYNRSGMDVEKVNPMIPIYTIFSIIPGSPADKAGLLPGDMIEYINYLPAFSLSLDDINNILYGEGGNQVLVRINRNGERLKVKIRLEEKI
jgi:hypothetical protein